MNLNSFCRTCFKNSNLINVFELCDSKKVLITEMLMECCSIKVNYNDEFSAEVCRTCLIQLHFFYDFLIKCKKTQFLFEQLKYVKEEQNDNLDLFEAHFENIEEKITIPDNKDFKQEKDYTNFKDSKDLNDLKDSKNSKNKKNYVCKKCGEDFDDKSKRDFHKATHLSYPCTKCDKIYTRKHNLVQHMLIHVDQKPQIPCQQCDKHFTMKSNLLRHINNTHKNIKPFKCNECEQAFSRKSTLMLHVNNHHSTTQKKGKRHCRWSLIQKGETCSPNVKERYTCKICKQYFYEEKLFIQHELQHKDSTVEKFKCDQCDIEFLFANNLLRHQNNIHNKIEKENKLNNLCTLCGKRFATQTQLDQHVFLHSNVRPYVCSHCQKSFKFYSGYIIHLRIHTNTRKYKCKFCEKSFIQTGQLRYHLFTHTGEKPYTCDICGKTFAVKVNMIVHRRQHTGETPYVCEICSKGFYHSTNLKRHKLKFHSADTPTSNKQQKLKTKINKKNKSNSKSKSILENSNKVIENINLNKFVNSFETNCSNDQFQTNFNNKIIDNTNNQITTNKINNQIKVFGNTDKIIGNSLNLKDVSNLSLGNKIITLSGLSKFSKDNKTERKLINVTQENKGLVNSDLTNKLLINPVISNKLIVTPDMLNKSGGNQEEKKTIIIESNFGIGKQLIEDKIVSSTSFPKQLIEIETQGGNGEINATLVELKGDYLTDEKFLLMFSR